MRYDIAIIGTGPAGLEAAITAKIRNKSILLLGSKDLSMKVAKAHTIQNYLGIPNVAGEDLAKAYSKHLEDMEIEITEDKINTVYAMGDYFALQGNDNVMYEADSVILASGVVTGKAYPGEDEFLGKGVSYCATCDGNFYKGKDVAVIGSSPKDDEEAEFLSEIVNKVYYFPLYKEECKVNDKIVVRSDKPLAIKGEGLANALETSEEEIKVDGVFIFRESLSPDKLVPGLELENNHVKVNRSLETNLPGLFACGDVTGTPYQYIKAAGEGNVAALSAAAYLAARK